MRRAVQHLVCFNYLAVAREVLRRAPQALFNVSVSYTHLTLPTIYSV